MLEQSQSQTQTQTIWPIFGKKVWDILLICDKRKNTISQTYCEITNLLWYHKPIKIFQKSIWKHKQINLYYHIPMVFLPVWVNIGQLYLYNCPVFTQTGRKTIGMWTFVKLQQVDVFKTMLIQKKQCSAQLSQAQPIELEFLKKLTN